MKKILLMLAAILYLGAFSANAFDFGLVFNQNDEIEAPDFNFEKTSFDISGVLSTRFTTPLGKIASLYICPAIR
ncbi:hypothetical protein R84B8_01536 [Treponema sp. R8-4-B8]